MGEEGNVLHRAVDVITRLAYLQILWIGGCLVGGVVLGLFPSTQAVYAIVKRWEEEGLYQIDHLYDAFKKEYKSEFFKSNKIGWVLVPIGLFLIFDMYLAAQLENILGMALVAIFFVLCICYILFLTCLFPMISHFDMTIKELVKNTFLISISSMGYVLINVAISSGMTVFFLIVLPASIPFFLVSILAVVNTKLIRKAFKRIEEKKEKYRLVGEGS